MVQNVFKMGSTAAVFGALIVSGASMGGCGMPLIKVSEDRVATVPVGAERFVLQNDVGDVTLVSSDAVTEITAAVHIVGKGTSTEKAQEVLDNLVIVLRYDENEPGTVLAGVQLEKRFRRNSYGVSVDWEIVMPSGVAIDLRTDVGDVEASGFVLGASVSTDVGDIKLIDMRGGVDARSDVGSIRVSSDGAVTARSDVGDVRITVLHGGIGDVLATADVGDVTVEFPADRVGHVHASTDIGSVSSSLDGADAAIHKKKRGVLVADLGGETEPTIELRTDIGSVRVKVGSGGAG